MLFIRFYWKEGCAKCPMAKKLVEDSGLKVESFNVEEVEGMAMANFHQVLATPSILILDSEDPDEIPKYDWRGEVPTSQEFKAIINRFREV